MSEELVKKHRSIDIDLNPIYSCTKRVVIPYNNVFNTNKINMNGKPMTGTSAMQTRLKPLATLKRGLI